MRRRPREDESSESRGLLFPIGLGLGALVAVALFFGVRGGTAIDDEASDVRAADTIDREPMPPAETATENLIAMNTPDAVPDAPTVVDPAVALTDPAAGTAGTNGLPGATDPETTDLFGGRIVMVSSVVPRVIVLADGTNLVPGETLPSGHRIIGIERERILLEREGVEWRVEVP